MRIRPYFKRSWALFAIQGTRTVVVFGQPATSRTLLVAKALRAWFRQG